VAIVTLHVVGDILATRIEREVTHLVAHLRKEHRIYGRKVRVLLSLYKVTLKLGQTHGTIELRCSIEYPTAYGILDVDKTLIA
jgi:hypothetical protein